MRRSGDGDDQPGRVQVLQDQGAYGEDATDWRQVCESTRTEGNLWHTLPTGGLTAAVLIANFDACI